MAIRAILLALILTLLLLLLYRLVLSNWKAASYLAALSVFFLLSYGHIYHALRDLLPYGLQVVRHRFLVPAAVIGFVLSFWFIRRRQGQLPNLTPLFNVVSLALLLIPSLQIIHTEFEYNRKMDAGEAEKSSCNLSVPEGKAPPDIYLIILDAYTRRDVLLERYNFENEPFLDELREMGFYIAEDARSNYAMTSLSLSSSLNMQYLLDHEENAITSKSDLEHDPLQEYPIVNNYVRTELECMGYKTVAYDSGWPITSWHNADYYFSPQKVGPERFYLAGANAFESLLINKSIGLFIIDGTIFRTSLLQEVINHPYGEHADRVLFALDIPESGVLNLPSPKFVFIHIVSPHFPYVFSAEGTFEDQSGAFTLIENEGHNALGYRDQVEFLNPKVLQMVSEILNSYDDPPIIILQGDHGSPNSIEARLAILSAYHLPGGGNLKLYPEISPVNNFRVIFNHYFDGSYSILEDRSYFSDHDAIYDFIYVPADTEQ